MEDLHSCNLGLVGGDWRLDANPVEHLEVIRVAYVYPNFKYRRKLVHECLLTQGFFVEFSSDRAAKGHDADG